MFVAASLVTSFAGVLVNVQSVSLRQAVAPDRLLGRVTGAFRTLAWGLLPVGNILGGFVTQSWGAVPTFWVSAAILAVSLAWTSASGLVGIRSLTGDGVPGDGVPEGAGFTGGEAR